jgi:hypothetical protein
VGQVSRPHPLSIDSPDHVYEIEVDGAPTLRCSLVLGITGVDHADMGCLATAVHAVHGIPALVAAPSALLDPAEVCDFVGTLL